MVISKGLFGLFIRFHNFERSLLIVVTAASTKLLSLFELFWICDPDELRKKTFVTLRNM